MALRKDKTDRKVATSEITDYGVPHVAIIMDGNGRWAKKRGWPRLAGHRKGAEQIKKIVREAPDLGIRYMTIYAFSTENWKRSLIEVLGLMKMFRFMIRREADALAAEGAQVAEMARHLGLSRLSPRMASSS